MARQTDVRPLASARAVPRPEQSSLRLGLSVPRPRPRRTVISRTSSCFALCSLCPSTMSCPSRSWQNRPRQAGVSLASFQIIRGPLHPEGTVTTTDGDDHRIAMMTSARMRSTITISPTARKDQHNRNNNNKHRLVLV